MASEGSGRDGDVSFALRVVPRASKSEIVGFHDGALKVRIKSPPVNGAANAELIRLLAKQFGVSKSDVEKGRKTQQRLSERPFAYKSS